MLKLERKIILIGNNKHFVLFIHEFSINQVIDYIKVDHGEVMELYFP